MAESDAKEYVTLGKQKTKILLDTFAEKSGRKNSAVWCRDIEELRGFLAHGRIDLEISENDARKVISLLIEKKMAEEIRGRDGESLGWNIHHNEEAEEPEVK